MFTSRSDVDKSNVATKKHNLKIFISQVDSILKYSFFHCTAIIWNTLVNDSQFI